MSKKVFIFINCLIMGILVSFFVQAAEVTYPQIGGISLPASPTFTDYFLYYFNLALFVGMVAAMIVIITAGFNYIFSRGEIGKIEKSKNNIIRALVGLVILFGSIVILNTINSSINQGTQIIENTVQYADGIVLKFASNNPPIPDSNLTGDLSETTHPVESIQWISKPEDLPRIFIFPKKDFQGDPQEVLNGTSTTIAVGSSIAFDWTSPGVYLYNAKNFQLTGRKSALVLLYSQPSLGVASFQDKTASIKIIQPKKIGNETPFEYRAVLFSEDNYSGKCAWIKKDLPDINEVNGEENKVRIGTSDNFEGIKKVNSIYVLQYDPNQPLYEVILYNGTNCQSQEALWDKNEKKFLPNTCAISEYGKELKFSETCSNMPQKPDTIISARIKDGTVLLLKDKDGNCQLFEKKGFSDCITSISYGIFNMENRKNQPLYMTILPGNTKQ